MASFSCSTVIPVSIRGAPANAGRRQELRRFSPTVDSSRRTGSTHAVFNCFNLARVGLLASRLNLSGGN